MALIPQTYNTADLPSSSGVVLIPPGYYQAVIIESEFKQTANGNGQFLALKVVLTQGQYANTEFIERLNIVNPNEKTVEIAYKTLARIAEAVGMTQTPSDSVQLHNKPLMVEIATEPGKPWTDKEGNQQQGKDKSIIKHYKPIPGGQAATPFAAAPAAAASPGTPPWAKR